MDVNILGFILNINVLILFMMGIAVALVISILIVLWIQTFKCCCKSKDTNIDSTVVVYMTKGVIHEDSYVSNPAKYAALSDAAKDNILIPYVSRSYISSMEKITQGFFGKVYKGILQQTDGKYETVAIKVLKNHINLDARQNFMWKIESMMYFRHPNILTLIGVCPQKGKLSPWLIFKFMEYGDLTGVLRYNHTEFPNYSDHFPILNKQALLVISLQISAGMMFLANQRYVHRDLACRNCLVDGNLTVKITDFGLSRKIYTCDYRNIGESLFLPERWMSPESFVDGNFTMESNVWSFGVVLWEIFTLGNKPYDGYLDNDVRELILSGSLLDIPLNCPLTVRSLMNGCWKRNPEERLRFNEIHKRLKNVTKRPELGLCVV